MLSKKEAIQPSPPKKSHLKKPKPFGTIHSQKTLKEFAVLVTEINQIISLTLETAKILEDKSDTQVAISLLRSIAKKGNQIVMEAMLEAELTEDTSEEWLKLEGLKANFSFDSNLIKQGEAQ